MLRTTMTVIGMFLAILRPHDVLAFTSAPMLPNSPIFSGPGLTLHQPLDGQIAAYPLSLTYRKIAPTSTNTGMKMNETFQGLHTKSPPVLANQEKIESMLSDFFQSRIQPTGELAQLKTDLESGQYKLLSRTLPAAQAMQANNRLRQLLRDERIDSAKIASIDLSALNVSRFRAKPIEMCLGPDGTCNPVLTEGWIGDHQQIMEVALVKSTNAQAGTAIFFRDKSRVSGVMTVGSKTFSVTPLVEGSNVFAVLGVEVADRNLDDVHRSEPAAQAEIAGRIHLDASLPLDDETACPNPQKNETLEILVGFTPMAQKAAMAKFFDIQYHAGNAEALANYSFSKSAINGSVKITRIELVDYKENPAWQSFEPLMSELLDPRGPFKTFRESRRASKADVAVLIVHSDSETNCGRAAAIGANRDNAYVVVNWKCLTDRHSFIHEIGHLAGAWHNTETLPRGTVVTPPYGSGFITRGAAPVATIMAYPSSCQKDRPCGRSYFWANPYRKTPDGQVLGTVESNFDACVWRKRLPILSRFDGGGP